MKGAIHSKDLREAARRVEACMLEAWRSEDGDGHVFSPSFDLRMEPLLTGARRRERRLRAAQTFAASFAIVLLCAFTWLASHAAARHAVQKWVRETWRNTVVYRFTDTREAALPKYRPTWLPEGYEETRVLEQSTGLSVTYQNENDDCIFFEVHQMHDGGIIDLITHPGEECTFETVNINGLHGELYISSNAAEQSNLIWMDDEAGVFYVVSATQEPSVILHIAESVSLAKLTKQQNSTEK